MNVMIDIDLSDQNMMDDFMQTIHDQYILLGKKEVIINLYKLGYHTNELKQLFNDLDNIMSIDDVTIILDDLKYLKPIFDSIKNICMQEGREQAYRIINVRTS